ncbi:O-methyltransferase [Bombiscardovia nodaiensis]|uniref:O-methyltransferase n=1 Tax=Bombiscardovia nodaiensis TaxID=2932181 RepID=A0ABM8B7Q4_9BIFI|nr:O-methyltransferase [Bombiscardovia nodaiensis]
MNKTSYTNHAKAWEYAEACALNAESEFLASSRALASEAGFAQSCVAQGAFLKVVARASRAQSIILVGTGSVVETIRLIEGLGAGGQFTAVDSSAQGVDLIRQTFRSLSGHTTARLRAVNAPAKAYFPRLNPRDYDLIVVAGENDNYRDALAEAPRLLRERGQILFTDAMCFAQNEEDGGIMNPANRSERVTMIRQILDDYQESNDFDACLLPVGTGILLAAKR